MKNYLPLAISTIVILVASGIYLENGHRNENTSSFPLVIDESQLSIGEVWSSRNLRTNLVVTNQSDSEVKLAEIFTSCNCLSIKPNRFGLQPGEEIKLDMVIDLEKNSRLVDHERRPFSVDLLARINHTGNVYANKKWVVSGIAKKNPLEADPGQVLVEAYVQNVKNVSKTISITSDISLNNLSASCPPEYGVVSVMNKGQDGEQNKRDISLTLNNNLGAGEYLFEIVASSELLEDIPGRRAKVSIPVLVRVSHSVEIFPKINFLGTLKGSSIVNETVNLRSMIGNDFKVLDVCVDTEGFTVSPVEGDGPEVLYRIKGSKSELGRHAVEVEFRVLEFIGETREPSEYKVIATTSFVQLAD